MSTYKKIRGTTVQNNAGNLPSAVDGQLWYDSTNAVFKHQYPNVTAAGAWSTGNNLNTGRETLAGAGTQTAALAFGGEIPPQTGVTESYDGTSWTEVNDLNTARYGLGGVGTQTAALGFGGNTGPNTVTESWNGTSWTEVNDLNTGRNILTGIGIQTSALATGGNDGARTAVTESWNGTSWTEVNDLNTARMRLGGNIGSDNTAGLVYGGNIATGPVASTESWNGTSWTEVNDLNTGRDGIRGTGTTSAGIAFAGETGGGAPGFTGATELWDGTSWTETTDMSTGRPSHASAGSQTSALAFGGQPVASNGALTEEWLGAGQPVGAWATGGSMNTARGLLGGAGTSSNSALAFGGADSPTATDITNLTESYDGTSWTEVNDLNTSRSNLK